MKAYLTVARGVRREVFRLWFMPDKPRQEDGKWTVTGCGSVEVDPSMLDARLTRQLRLNPSEPLEVEIGIQKRKENRQ